MQVEVDITAIHDNKIIQIKLTKKIPQQEKMGDDSVIECINEVGAVKAYSSYTTVGEKFDAQRVGVVS